MFRPAATNIVSTSQRLMNMRSSSVVTFFATMQAMIPINEAPLEVAPREVAKVHHECCEQVKKQDVLLGRGKCNFKHCGNIAYRMLIDTRLEKYIASDSRSEKTHMVVEVVESIFESGGRFLKQDVSLGDGWFVVDKKTAREKVGHSFRDAIKARNGVTARLEEKPSSSISVKSSFSEILHYIELQNSRKDAITTGKVTGSHVIEIGAHSDTIVQVLLKSEQVGSLPSQRNVLATRDLELRNESKMLQESTSTINLEQISKRAAAKYKSLSEDARIRAFHVAIEGLSHTVASMLEGPDSSIHEVAEASDDNISILTDVMDQC